MKFVGVFVVVCCCLLCLEAQGVEKQRWLESLNGLPFCDVIGDPNLHGKYIVGTNQKDEARLAEWIAHHLLIGFDAVIIFDDSSADLESLLAPLPQSAREKVLIFIRCEGPHQFVDKMTLQERLGNVVAGIMKAEWSLHLDADEFLFVNKNQFPSGVKDFYATFPNNTRQVACNWMMFGTSFREKEIDTLSILRAYTYRESKLFQLVKTSHRTPSPEYPQQWKKQGPHYMVLPNVTNYSATANGARWNESPFNPSSNPFDRLDFTPDVPCFIAHYLYQSMETCFKRKINRFRDDMRKKRDASFCSHDMANDINDPELTREAGMSVENYLLSHYDPPDAIESKKAEKEIVRNRAAQKSGLNNHQRKTMKKRHNTHEKISKNEQLSFN